MRLGNAAHQVVFEGRARAGAEMVILRFQHLVRDPQQVAGGIVRKIQVMRDARAQPGVGAEEGLHPVLVARQDHDQIVALIFHHLQQYLDGFLPVIALVFRAIQVVGLVDEEHAPHGLLQHLFGLGRGVSDVLADQIVAGHRHQVAFAHIPQPMQDLRHAQGNRSFAGAGIAREGHVQAGCVRLQPEIHAQLVYHQQCGDVANAALDRRQPDQILIEFVDHGSRLALRKDFRDRACAGRAGVRCGGSIRRRLRNRGGVASGRRGRLVPGNLV